MQSKWRQKPRGLYTLSLQTLADPGHVVKVNRFYFANIVRRAVIITTNQTDRLFTLVRIDLNTNTNHQLMISVMINYDCPFYTRFTKASYWSGWQTRLLASINKTLEWHYPGDILGLFDCSRGLFDDITEQVRLNVSQHYVFAKTLLIRSFQNSSALMVTRNASGATYIVYTCNAIIRFFLFIF